jgi:hypothetical protein
MDVLTTDQPCARSNFIASQALNVLDDDYLVESFELNIADPCWAYAGQITERATGKRVSFTYASAALRTDGAHPAISDDARLRRWCAGGRRVAERHGRIDDVRPRRTAAVRGGRVMPADSNSKIVATFRGGKGPDAPRVVIHANSVQELAELVTGEAARELMALLEKGIAR